eukprot:TRINITY_DN16374_c0_g1_i9.p5 TRINITY_DN16374_c0_g1~~TRINITY_DN16374_c0_g1_i9.p5  ORF type:complete len:122 (+),score=6.00 TRINITY_DN16374_c0_g1_i9:105-470(+)
MNFSQKVQDIVDLELVCHCCQLPFIAYQDEPEWCRMPQYKYDIPARNQKREEWRKDVQNRFFVRFECGQGCSGVCLECAKKCWEQAKKNAKRRGKCVKKCLFCQTKWHSEPIPFRQYIFSL